MCEGSNRGEVEELCKVRTDSNPGRESRKEEWQIKFYWSTATQVHLFIHKVLMLPMRAKSLQPSLTLCDPRVCSQPGSSVHGILQARILEWVAISSSRASF